MIAMNSYVKILDDYTIAYAPNHIIDGDTFVTNPTKEQLNELGYYELYTDYTDEEAPRWYRYVIKYTQEDDKVVARNELQKLPCPVYGIEVSRKIRQRYSQADVEAIILNGNDTEEHAQDYANLQAYRAECKEQVKSEIDEWEKA